MGNLTTEDRMKREDDVRDMLERGCGTVEIAKAVGVSRQAMHRFLHVRGWLPKGVTEGERGVGRKN